MNNSNNSDEQQLLALHQAVIDAHLNNNVEILLRDEEDAYVIGNRGEVTHPTKEQRRNRLGPYLKATAFEHYRDEIHPIVKVSQDGTLGWVIVQVYVRGQQDTGSDEPASVEFDSAWIELYEKQNGRWLRIGNVSNIRPLNT